MTEARPRLSKFKVKGLAVYVCGRVCGYGLITRPRTQMLSVPGRKPSRFCPRTVVQDGNEFYVLASTLLFGVHDNHQEVRRRLWNAFSLSVLGERLDDIAEGHVNPAGGIRRNEWFAAWMECCALGLALDESDTVSIRRALVGSVRRYSCVGKLAPLQLACGLLAIVYGIGVVLYDTAHEGGSSLGEWHPIRTWEPPENTVPPIRYMNLMQRTGALQMLFEIPIDDDTNDTMGPRNMRNCIPTRMITSLPLSFKTDATFEPVASDIVERHAVYKLHVYDSATRYSPPASLDTSPPPLADNAQQTKIEPAAPLGLLWLRRPV